MASIPASELVNVVPSVIGAGGTGVDLNGLVLTHSTRVPIGTAKEFGTAPEVADYFGAVSDEYGFAQDYFLGYDNSPLKPGALLFVQYPAAPVAAYLRGGDVSDLTLTQLQAISGILTLTVDGVTKSTASLNLAAASSFSAAAAIIDAALTTATIAAAASYDAQAGAFVITSDTTGATSTLAFATGPAATLLELTAATGAELSQGAIAGVPGTAMTAVEASVQNWFSFTHLWDAPTADKVLFAEWNNSRANRFAYVFGDDDAAGTVTPDTTSAMALIKVAGYAGVMGAYSPGVWDIAAMIMGTFASIDFDREEGRITLAFRAQAGLVPGVTDAPTARALIANGYNFYGAYATANEDFRLLQPGRITGDFLWADSYANQVWMNDGLQVNIMTLMREIGSLPYNAEGYGKVEAACADTINAAVTFGAIRAGVPLSAIQVAAVNAAAGLRISDTLQQRGWFLQVKPASAEVRAQRGSPPCTLWYVDGQSIQSINLASIQVQ